MLRLAMVLNPLAGLGGAVALKGSDGQETVTKALSLGAESHVSERVAAALAVLADHIDQLRLITYPGEMGADVCKLTGIPANVIGSIHHGRTTAADTQAAIRDFQEVGADLILFAGGDGSAQDICAVVNPGQPVLGIPCGVKMHSGVFAIDPSAAGAIVRKMMEGDLINIKMAEVRDIDEEAFRRGVVNSRYCGEMLVPEEAGFLQQVKSGGREVEALVAEDIAAEIIENMQPHNTYFIGSGSTTAAIMTQLGLANTLLGFDVVKDGELLLADATETQLLAAVDEDCTKIILAIIGGQGHILGRGNQQLSPAVIRKVGLENIIVVGSKTKIKELQGRPLLVDTGDPELDSQFNGFIRVATGYDDWVIYKVGLTPPKRSSLQGPDSPEM
ncbi:MAG: ATP-NAD kinase family protein [Pseudomonadales bacterium]|nr:ATP-NAD kinase family protein [Pseudomonadales bacterium]MDP7359627.1 ATP-NAD kinase family protein [Pseudomonadales bacterium]MDP7595944.1 ATP-NAD kinase family protein [Pseudomonadales bacterium]HJN50893.1 ATP-NAD kinase family protein [Pseudomonadales bacterium]